MLNQNVTKVTERASTLLNKRRARKAGGSLLRLLQQRNTETLQSGEQ